MRSLTKKMMGAVMVVGLMLTAAMPVVMNSGVVEARYDSIEAGGGGGSQQSASGSGSSDSTPNPEGTITGSGASGKVETTILPDNWGIEEILQLVLNVVVYGLGVAAVLGVVIAGIMYMTARDNEAQAAAARKRLLEVAIGLVAWALMYGVLNWLIPGGLSI